MWKGILMMKARIARPAMFLFFCAALMANLFVLAPSVTQAEETMSLSELVYLGKDADKVGKEYGNNSQPDGELDHHFQVKVDIPETMEIWSLFLTTSDSKGNETGNSVMWSTWDGWFLGVFKDGKLVTNKQVDTLGRFGGSFVLDLYAADDGNTFIDGQHFVVHTETNIQNYYSNPVKFEKVDVGIAVPSISGGKGSVTVKGAQPAALVTLLQREGDVLTNFGVKAADSKGQAVFTNLPAKDGYYAYQTVEGESSDPTDTVKVTPIAAAKLLDEKSIVTTVTVDQDNQFNVKVTGKVADKKVTKVNVQFGGFKKDVKVSKGAFTYTTKLKEKDFSKTIRVGAKVGTKEHAIIKQVDSDLVDDETVIAEVDGNDWSISGELVNANVSAIYVVANKQVIAIDDLEFAGSEFSGSFESSASSKDIAFIAVTETGEYEVLYIAQ